MVLVFLFSSPQIGNQVLDSKSLLPHIALEDYEFVDSVNHQSAWLQFLVEQQSANLQSLSLYLIVEKREALFLQAWFNLKDTFFKFLKLLSSLKNLLFCQNNKGGGLDSSRTECERLRLIKDSKLAHDAPAMLKEVNYHILFKRRQVNFYLAACKNVHLVWWLAALYYNVVFLIVLDRQLVVQVLQGIITQVLKEGNVLKHWFLPNFVLILVDTEASSKSVSDVRVNAAKLFEALLTQNTQRTIVLSLNRCCPLASR